ncbi:MAG: hypothetical protein NC035_09230 [Bacteroides sp.]|nr:hypothetical protein [Bacteroides sp.]
MYGIMNSSTIHILPKKKRTLKVTNQRKPNILSVKPMGTQPMFVATADDINNIFMEGDIQQ